MNRLITFMCVLFVVGTSPVYAGHHHDRSYSYDRSHSRSYDRSHSRRYDRSHHRSHRHSGSAAALGFLGGFVVGNMMHRPVSPPRRVIYTTPYYQSPTEQAFMSNNGFVRRQLQSRLQQMGFYYSYIDGIWGPGTQSAFEDYALNSGNAHMLTSYAGAKRMMRMLLRYDY